MATKRLVHISNNNTVKDNDKVQTEEHGLVTVKSIMQPRKKRGSGRVRVQLPDGRTVDVHPGHVRGKWI